MVLENSASWEPALEHDDSAAIVPELAGGVPLIKVVGIGGGGQQRGEPHVQGEAAGGRILRGQHRRPAPVSL